MEGEFAFFHCVTNYPDISIATWYKDGVPLTDLADISQRTIVGSDGSMSINPTSMIDLGEYVCVVRSIEHEEQEARAFLNVQCELIFLNVFICCSITRFSFVFFSLQIDKAKVVYAPPEVYFPFGEPAILDCHFRANPPLKKLRWEKDGFLFDPYNVQVNFFIVFELF